MRKMIHVDGLQVQVYIGSVLSGVSFRLPASEKSDKSETGSENRVSVPAESSHVFPFCTAWSFLAPAGPKSDVFREGSDKKSHFK